MRSFSVWPKDASVCFLSEVLETQVASKYFLSPKACAGILRRAEKRGKELPEQLARALMAVAALEPISSAGGGLSKALKAQSNCKHRADSETYIPTIAQPLAGISNGGALMGQEEAQTTPKGLSGPVSSKWSKGTGGPSGDECYNLVTHPLTSEGHDGSEDGTERGTPLVPDVMPAMRSGTAQNGPGHGARSGDSKDEYIVAFQPRYYTRDNKTGGTADDITPPILAAESRSRGDAVTAIAFTERTRADGRNFEAQPELAYALTNPGSGGRTHSRSIAGQFGVRRLTPTECERLMGTPEGWTSGFADSPRYRMLGNSVAVPVVQWIARRIRQSAFRQNRGGL